MDSQLYVVHKDDRLIAVCKPSGMAVHRGWCDDAVTAADIVRDEIIKAPVHAVHRLDRGTSGILIFALDSEAARHMQSAMTEEAEKHYVALVRGPFREAIRLDHPVPARRREARVDAVTEFIPLAQKDRWTLVQAKPLTGRLHQIRRHLKHLNCPIVGDVRYGKGEVNRMFRDNYALHRLALHSYHMRVRHPDGNMIEFSAPLTDDLQLPLERLGIEINLPV